MIRLLPFRGDGRGVVIDLSPALYHFMAHVLKERGLVVRGIISSPKGEAGRGSKKKPSPKKTTNTRMSAGVRAFVKHSWTVYVVRLVQLIKPAKRWECLKERAKEPFTTENTEFTEISKVFLRVLCGLCG